MDTFSDSDASLPGSLTPDQFQEDPTQPGANRSTEADRDLRTFRIGQRTEWETINGRWSFYTNYQNLHFDHLINEGLFRFNRLIDLRTDEVQAGIAGEIEHDLFGGTNTLRLSTTANYGVNDETGFSGFVVPGRPAAIVDRQNIAWNVQTYVENDLEFAPSHHFILGVGGVYSDREVTINPGETTGDPDVALADRGLTYRIGYLHELSETTQLFTNFSQSFEGSPFSETELLLDPQISRTFEIGARFSNRIASGELTAYRSAVNDEFVDIELAPGFSTTTNIDTIHQGIEAALFLNLSEATGLTHGPELFFDQSYQLNDFVIDQGPDAGNRFPGISRHVYSARVRLKDREDRAELALSADWLPEGFVVNNANTLFTDGHVNFRLNAGVKLTERIRFYTGIDNLFDERFVNNAVVNPSSDEFINPGTERSYYAGFKYQW